MRRIRFFASLVALAAACGGDPDPPASSYGDACGPDTPCTGDLSCVSEARFPGGYCTEVCDGTCSGDADCDDTFAPPLCLARCTSGDDCRDEYQCWRGGCRPPCASDGECGGAGATCRIDGVCEGAECATRDDCGPGQACRDGACVEAPPDAGIEIPPGTPCADASDCTSGVCLPPELGGVCSLECVDAEECFVFTTEAGCSPLPTDDDGDGTPDRARPVCVPAPPGAVGVGALCTSDEDCLARVCQDGQCSEVCDGDDDCVPGMRCTTLARAGVPGATYSGCGYPPISSTTIEEVDYGTFDVRAGFGEDVRLASAPDAVSVTFQAEQVGGFARELSFFSVVDPTGEEIFDVSQIVMAIDQPIRWIPVDTGESASLLVPNTTPDRVTFVPGVHEWNVGPIPDAPGDTTSVTLRLSALVKRAPGGAVTSGTIDLMVFLCGLRGGPTAGTAASNSRLQNSLARLDSILAPTGVAIGSVSYFDVSDTAFRVIDTTDGPTSELADLFRLSAGRSGRAVNVFLVRSITASGGGFRALGIAGGIPGPVGIHGTYHSGVVVSFDAGVVGSGATGENVIGQIMAHEIGHYVGLYHSTEQRRPCGPGETPAMDDCSPFGGGDQLADTTRGDDRNLMYWSIVGGGTNTRLSAGQGHVFRMSALAGP